MEIHNTMQPFNRTCIPGKAKVLTDQGWKRVLDIKIGDQVLTHAGRYRRVIDVMSRSARDGRVSVRPRVRTRRRLNKLLVTDNHPILTKRGWVKAQDLVETDTVATLAISCKGCGGPIYFRNEYCSRPCQAKTKDYQLKHPKFIPIPIGDFELGRLVGGIDGEGCISARVDTSGRGTFNAYITVTNNDIQWLEHLQAQTGFGIIRKHSAKKERVVQTWVWWIDRKDEVFSLLRIVSPHLIVKRRVAELVLRLFDALNAPSHEERYSIQLEAYTELRTQNLRGMAIHANIPRLAVTVASPILEQKLLPSFIYVPIRLKRYAPSRPHRVYNLEVEEDHSYVAQGIVVHNCAESYLSGCKLIVNSLVGATSWPWFTDRDSVRFHLKAAPAEFWVKLEEVLKL